MYYFVVKIQIPSYNIFWDMNFNAVWFFVNEPSYVNV